MADLQIPQDSELVAELVGLRWHVDSRGRIQVESKDEMKKRGLRSPDKADALMLAYGAEGRILAGTLGI
jgi:hypothetical protein